MKLYETEFINISFEEKKSVIKFTWTPETGSERFFDAEFTRELRAECECVEKVKARFILIDAREFMYPISPDVQSWIENEVYPRWAKAGAKKIAVLLPKDLIAQISVEQAIEENKEEAMTSAFFGEPEAGYAWLGV
jgi:hypothetical protein